jgi:glucosamine-6-phosphate deaminase
MNDIDAKQLYAWCKIPAQLLENHVNLKIPFRIVKDSLSMGEIMAKEFVEDIKTANQEGRVYRAIVPCGPKCWYEPFTRMVNEEKISLKNLVVFHMDECLDWEGNLLAKNDPYNFRTFMEKYFYDGIHPELSVPDEHKYFLEPSLIEFIKQKIAEAPIDLTLGGWGQDGHMAYNQSRRNPYSQISIEQLRNSQLRIQDNNWDTILALANRTFGAAYQFVPPMSITLGMKECLSAKKVRVFSDTGAWKQTALRVALFSKETTEYPMTLLQSHPNTLITATLDTAIHPISINPEWEFKGINI